MGICWSDPSPPPATQRVYYAEPQKVMPSAPTFQLPPPMYPPQAQQYTYAQQPQQYTYAYPQPSYMYTQQQPQNRISTTGAVVGGVILGSILEDITDPM